MSNYVVPEVGGEVTQTSYDPATGICKYVVRSHLNEWYVEIPLNILEEYGDNKIARKQHFINAVKEKMKSPPDKILNAEAEDAV